MASLGLGAVAEPTVARGLESVFSGVGIPDGVTDTFTAQFGGWPSLELADEPRPLPVVLTADATATTDTAPFVDDALGRQVALQRAAAWRRFPTTSRRSRP